MEIIIRSAAGGDLHDLLEIRPRRETWEDYFRDATRGLVHLLVAAVNGKVIGFGLLKLGGGGCRPKLSDLFVRPEFRRQGIGGKLIEAREELARSLEYDEIFVSVDPIENPRMAEMVKDNGFALITPMYEKEAEFVDGNGNLYTRTYTRIDYRKEL